MSETCQKLGFTHPIVVLKSGLKNNWMKKLDRVNRPLNNYPWTRLSVGIIGVIKDAVFHMVMYVFDNSNLSQEISAIDRHLESCNMLFGTWSQAHAYNPSDYMETRLN